MSDLLKRLGIGGGIGLLVAFLIGWGTYEIPFLKSLLDGYEFLSYDGRMRSRTSNVEQMSIDDVVIIDIDNTSVSPPEEGGLGHYFDWPQAYHGRLINTVSSGNPAALLFDIIFDKEQMLSFEGNTGPYLQYTYARICSIFRKLEEEVVLSKDTQAEFSEQEKQLIKKVTFFKYTCKQAWETRKPNLLSSYLFELAQEFNSFYANHPILSADSSETKLMRVKLTKIVQVTLRQGLGLLGIKPVSEM